MDGSNDRISPGSSWFGRPGCGSDPEDSRSPPAHLRYELSMNRDIAVEFQNRRRKAWLAARPWIFLGAIGAIGFWVPFWINSATTCAQIGMLASRCRLSLDAMPLWQLNLTFLSFVAMALSIVAITAAVRRHYRCPRCEALPWVSSALRGPTSYGIRRGIAFNPRVCANCGAHLC